MRLSAPSFKSVARAALVSAVLASSALAAAPAHANSTVQFGFNFGNNGNDSFGFSFGNGGFNGRHFGHRPAPQPVCMGDEELRHYLRNQGYRWIYFEGGHRGWLRASARQYGRLVEFDVNRCNGQIANLRMVGWR